MFSFCRLCAKWMDRTDLFTELSELQSKLVFCCSWKPSQNEEKMPKKVCNSCVEKLESCWNFIESIWAAEKQLNKLIFEPVEISTIEVTPYLQEVKNETTMPKLKEFSISLERIKIPFDNDNSAETNSIQADDFNIFDDDVFGEPIKYSDTESVEPNKGDKKENAKKKTKNRKRQQDRFLANISPEDCLNSGIVSDIGIKKLEELLPDMKTISWNDIQYKCEKCDRNFIGQTNFYVHIRAIHSEELMSFDVPCFYCNCNSKHRRDNALNKHIASKHFIHLKYRCAHCPDYFWNRIELTKHQKMHTNLEFTCELCGQVFASRSIFYAHITLNHFKKKKPELDEKYICDICKKEFTTKGGVRNHMLLHTKKFDYVCHQCGWKFKAKGNLKEHLNSAHTTVRAFKCMCGKRFKTKHQLNNHAKHHEPIDDVKNFVCEVCGRKFRRPYTLNVHMRSHTNTCPYTCRFCGKSFRHNITLRTHERAHTDDKPYPCPICEYRSTAKGNLNKHMMRVHSIDYRNHLNYPEDKIHQDTV